MEECYLFSKEGHFYYDRTHIFHHQLPEVLVNDPSLPVETKPVSTQVAEQEKMPIASNKFSSQIYMTQEIPKPSLVPETALAKFDTEDQDIWIGDRGASSHH